MWGRASKNRQEAGMSKKKRVAGVKIQIWLSLGANQNKSQGI
jgi:hypothetical protein